MTEAREPGSMRTAQASLKKELQTDSLELSQRRRGRAPHSLVEPVLRKTRLTAST
jgi:hypothetical protein